MRRKGKNTNRGSRAPLIIALVLGLAVLAGGFAIMSGGSIGSGGGSTITISSAPVSTGSVQKGLEEFRGKVVVLDFWATWCGPCRSEIPGLIALQEKYRDQGVEIIGVSIDPIAPRGGGAAAVEPFMKRFGINYTIWMANDVNALAGYDVSQGIPTKYVLDRNGKIDKKYVGARSPSVIEGDIKRLL
ncbi:MAG: TlpA family protein disulfide reductase [Blastocatellia bacterium]|nr:TlpA family protein disulfide reductase [Blastocatellia bacterium]